MSAHKINGFTVLMALPRVSTLFRTIGEDHDFEYIIVADNGTEAVTAWVTNPETDGSWFWGNYGFTDPDPRVRRIQALVNAIERAGLREIINDSLVLENLSKVFGNGVFAGTSVPAPVAPISEEEHRVANGG